MLSQGRLCRNGSSQPLAFIGGPGEIAYWAELKRVFEEMGILMPPLVPRLNITLLERAVQRDIEELELDIGHVLKYGTRKEREKYWNDAKDENMDALIAETENMLKMQYDKIFAAIGKGLEPLARKNLDFHLGQLAFLQRKVDEEIAGKHENILEKYARVERALRPDGNPQERVWNLFISLTNMGRTLSTPLPPCRSHLTAHINSLKFNRLTAAGFFMQKNRGLVHDALLEK